MLLDRPQKKNNQLPFVLFLKVTFEMKFIHIKLSGLDDLLWLVTDSRTWIRLTTLFNYQLIDFIKQIKVIDLFY